MWNIIWYSSRTKYGNIVTAYRWNKNLIAFTCRQVLCLDIWHRVWPRQVRSQFRSCSFSGRDFRPPTRCTSLPDVSCPNRRAEWPTSLSQVASEDLKKTISIVCWSKSILFYHKLRRRAMKNCLLNCKIPLSHALLIRI